MRFKRSRQVLTLLAFLLLITMGFYVNFKLRPPFWTSHDFYVDSKPNHASFVAFVVPSRSKSDWFHPLNATLITTLLPSLERSLTPDAKFRIEVLVVFDNGDVFWETPSIMDHTRASTKFPVHFISVEKSGRIPHNEGCRQVYEMGADYIVRVNDDTEFLSANWLELAIQTLQGFKPSNFGVVGPTCADGNVNILTHDMVHRTHLDMFEEYYPSEFDNWWLDDWISAVYGERHTKKLEEWRVAHNTHSYGQRYTENLTQQNLLPEVLLRSKQQLIDSCTIGPPNHTRTLIAQSPGVTVYKK